MTRQFRDRREAGAMLATHLSRYAGRDDVIVLGLPRGGVPVAVEVARALNVACDVLVVRKVGVPHQPELAMGAVASGGITYVNEEIVRAAGVDSGDLAAVISRERAELDRRNQEYRGDRPPLDLSGKTVIVVDDGLATGSTMVAAVNSVRSTGAARIAVAVPVGPPSTCADLETIADDVVCAVTPPHFMAVGSWYEDFDQVTDEEVRAVLAG